MRLSARGERGRGGEGGRDAQCAAARMSHALSHTARGSHWRRHHLPARSTPTRGWSLLVSSSTSLPALTRSRLTATPASSGSTRASAGASRAASPIGTSRASRPESMPARANGSLAREERGAERQVTRPASGVIHRGSKSKGPTLSRARAPSGRRGNGVLCLLDKNTDTRALMNLRTKSQRTEL